MQRKGKKRRKLGDLKDHVLGIKRKKRKSVLLFGKQDDFASFPPPPPPPSSSAVNSENRSSSFSRCSELAKHNATSLRNQQGGERKVEATNPVSLPRTKRNKNEFFF
jgi:hypothetical protein